MHVYLLLLRAVQVPPFLHGLESHGDGGGGGWVGGGVGFKTIINWQMLTQQMNIGYYSL